MGSRILFVAGPDDIQALNDYIRSLGLHLVSRSTERSYSDNPLELAGCFISPVPADQLHTDPRYPTRRSEAIDPLIPYLRSRLTPPYLTPGDIFWNNDVKRLAIQTKPTFQKLARWIRKNWPKPEGDDYHFGPQAMKLVFEDGVIATSLVPGVQVFQVPVYSDE